MCRHVAVHSTYRTCPRSVPLPTIGRQPPGKWFPKNDVAQTALQPILLGGQPSDSPGRLAHRLRWAADLAA